MTTSYDAVAYPGHAYPQTHPDRLAVQAALFGMDPAPPTGCRVLELGAGDGGNLIPMALALPGSTFLGLDLAEEAVARGRARAEALGATNLELRCADLRALPDDLGSFDYVIAHGVYSWIPPDARDALVAAFGSLLRPQGVAYVSYNAYPGSYLRDMAGEILAFHLDGVGPAQERIEGARRLMRLVVAANARTPYADVLRQHFERVLQHPDPLLFHDDLAEVNTAVYFHELVAHAARHGLQFLAEARLHDSQLHQLPDEVSAALHALPDDVVVREQHIDFIVNRMFRQTLLCRQDVALDRGLDPRRLRAMSFAGALSVDGGTFGAPSGTRFTPHDARLTAALTRLAEAWPAAVPYAELIAGLGEPAAFALGSELLEVHSIGVIELHRHPPPVAVSPSERPRAPALARLQAAEGSDRVVSLRHAGVQLEDPLARRLLTLLDGTRDRAALLGDIEAFVTAGGLAGTGVDPPSDLAAGLDAALEDLSMLSLLEQ